MIIHAAVLLQLLLAEGQGAAVPPPTVAAEAPVDTGEAKTAAQAALVQGNKRLKDGDVAGAIEEYRRAQAIYPPSAAKLEFNIAKAEETRGDEPAAAAAYERFLSQSLEIPPEYREEARNELHRLSTALGTLKLTERRPGYAVVVDGQVQGKTPLDAVWVRPGHHVLTLEEDDHVMFRDDVDVSGGATLQIMVTIHHDATRPAVALAPSPPPAPPLVAPTGDATQAGAGGQGRADEQDRSVFTRWWFWAAAGAVVAAGTTAIILGTRSDCPVASCKSVQVQGP